MVPKNVLWTLIARLAGGYVLNSLSRGSLLPYNR